jgi:dethiobiotin synthetase
MTLFVTGTDTDVGKTLISSWICLHTQASYWKPIQTGACSSPLDQDVVHALAKVPIYPESYIFKAPLSPHAAARAENTVIDTTKIIKSNESRLVVEGAGGVLVPLAPSIFLIDLIQQWHSPVLIVARSGLGTINHTCLTLEALRHRQIPILGVILNGPSNPSNKQAIEDYGKTPVLAEFMPLSSVSSEELAKIPLPSPLKKALETVL